jgi:hypothetical protein
MQPRLTGLFLVCFFLCSVAAMHGQSSFGEAVNGDSGSGPGCSNVSTTKKKISVSCSWTDPEAVGSEMGVAKNGFGSMGAYAFSSITAAQDKISASDAGTASDTIEDYLSIVGLNDEPTAFLKVEFECIQCVDYDYPATSYTAYAGAYGPCQITGIGTNPLCTLSVPISYNVNEQPNPVPIQRQLQVQAITNVVYLPIATTVTTTVCVGYSSCGTIGATAKASVVDGKGKVIKGVTVVGASGHIYN